MSSHLDTCKDIQMALDLLRLLENHSELTGRKANKPRAIKVLFAFFTTMQEKEKTLDVVENEITDEDLQYFVECDSQLSYYNEYNLYISNQYAQC